VHALRQAGDRRNFLARRRRAAARVPPANAAAYANAPATSRETREARERRAPGRGMSLAMRSFMRRAVLVTIALGLSLCANARAEGPAPAAAVVAAVATAQPTGAEPDAARAAAAAAAAKADARARALEGLRRELASAFGMIALVAATPGGPPKPGSSVWAREAPPSGPRLEVAEAMWRGNVVDGPIELGPPDDEVAAPRLVPAGAIATVGRGEGLVDVDAVDHGQGRLPPIFKTHLPVRQAASLATLTHRVPPEAIQRIVRSHYGAFHVCYDSGLRRDSSLAGRIVVRFTIDGAGVVTQASDSGSDLRDADVVACVVRGFLNLPFPASEGAKVTVVYPLSFSPLR
jgi:hypothetical protein